MTDPLRLSGWGLRIRSALDLPGAVPLPSGLAGVDLDIGFGAVEPEPGGQVDGPYRTTREGLVFTMPGVARYGCTTTAITVEPDPGADPAYVAAMLIATAIPAVLWARGLVVLHGAAAILPGSRHAVAVVGPSGSGKSTLLAQAVATGARIVADDSICVHAEGTGIAIGGLPGGYFAPLVPGATERAFRPVPADRQAARAGLGGLIVLDDGAPPARLTGAEAARAVLAQRHRSRVARLLRTDGAALAVVARVCRTVPVFRMPSIAVAAATG